jgi:isoleucyl-tRNA synthetase
MTKYYREPAAETFPQLEEEILRLWEAQGILGKVRERMQGGPPLVFCEGPPTANSRPHIGHALTRAVKDAFLRYHVMNGRKVVPYIGGWDCHGLPVELEVERSLGLHSKKDIEAVGVERFNALCRESVVRYKAEWEQMSKRIGYWLDFENAYLTMSNDYIESVWWSVKLLHADGLVTRGFQVLPYCPRCGTTLSTHEVALGFKETEDRVVIARARVKGLDASILVYTATPWSLVGNVLVAVDRGQTYVVVDSSGERLIVSEARLEAVLPGSKPVSRIPGSDLLGKEYEPLFDLGMSGAKAFRIVHSSAVSKDEGTGAMQISPAHGSLDFELGMAEGVELFDPVDDAGRFLPSVPGLGGRLAHDSSAEVMRMLESRGLLFRWGLWKHSHPFCWRCDSPLIYKPRESWFVRASAAKDRLISLNNEIRWVPESFKEGRFGNFLSEAKDWSISRSRYWGTPMPIWRCAHGHELCVGSIDELREAAGGTLPGPVDLHRPYVDAIVLKCPDCGGPMRREEYVLDCWYDSGCAPFAQYHYPFENMEEFDTHRSVDFISESVDQTRGWFYTQHVISTLLFDAPAFKSVLVMGNVLDEHGSKMRPDSGNIVYWDEEFSSVGADASRLFLLSSPVWQSVQFSQENVRKNMVGTLTTLLNVYSFFASNANAYGYSGQAGSSRTHDLDRWIVSRMNGTVDECVQGFESMEVHLAVRAVRSFIEDLSNWYVRRSRRRFWQENDPEDRFSAHWTLHECLMTLCRVMAPLTPFFSDWMYRNLKGPLESVHLEPYPAAIKDAIDGSLEAQMACVREAVEAGRLARQKVDVKLRQPLETAVVTSSPDKVWILRKYERMLSEELNVKQVECAESRERMVEYSVLPNLRTLGPRLKEGAAEVSKLLEKMDGNDLAKHLKSKGRIRLGGFDLYEEDVIIAEREKTGYSHAQVADTHVYVSLDISQKLRLEGLTREVIRRIQHMRKEQKLAFEDPIDIEYSGHHDFDTVFSAFGSHIRAETHARSIKKAEDAQDCTKWTVNKMPLGLMIRKA